MPMRAQGRPRDSQTHQAILDCALQHARTKVKFGDITMGGIALDAGVAKSTIYRWWKTKRDLLNEACFAGQLQDPAGSDLRSDLENLILQSYQMYKDRASRGVFAGFLAACIEESGAHPEYRNKPVFPFEQVTDDILTAVFVRAAARGEVATGANIRAMNRTIGSVLFYNCITYDLTCNARRLSAVVEQVMAASKRDVEGCCGW